MILYHRTDIYNAYKKVVSRQTWSKDCYQQANFHTEKHGGGSDCKNEITLHFNWSGSCANGEPSKWPGPPNVLFESNWPGSSSLWSLFLFPGTNAGLTLTGYSNIEIEGCDDVKHKKFILNKIKEMTIDPIDISVPTVSKRKIIISVPELPMKSLFSRLLGK
ncbi:hypothetical protein [Pseudomonas extremaustralis]|uniref:hypothetical protein n=1 Tax=Pseudomonas extremaustralis TaxID=359110 RepID=UPI0023072A57|nr:hypothetical protein [Pseudomonas extremaustralis]MDB1113902.1 hypothetical protein [Pseudomonas extremaustralis]